jgi:hypothetical protein
MNLGTILRDLEIVNLKVLVLYSLLVASLERLFMNLKTIIGTIRLRGLL